MITTPTDTPRRLVVATAMVLAAVIAVVIHVPAASADQCEIIGCWPECRPVPGGRVCREVCRRRCWRSAPQYVPPPAPYVAPYVPAPVQGIDPVPVLAVLAGVIVIVVLIIAVAASADSAIDEVNSDTAETERETAETYALITKLEAAARDADAHLNRFLADTRHPRD
jgi:hypothetical protein